MAPVIFTDPLPYNLNVPVLAVKVVKAKVDDATKIPVFPLIVPAPVRAPVVVATPEPMTNVPVLVRVDENSLLPLTDPMLPALVTAPVNVRVPEVEVTVVPEPMVDAPVTERARAADERVPPPMVVRVPPIAGAVVVNVAVPDPFLISTLLNVAPSIL